MVCPLAFEEHLLRRAGIGARGDLCCCGPGSAAVARWAAERPAGATVILSGLAGALRPEIAAGTASVASTVLDGDGSSFEPTIETADGLRLVSVPATLTTAGDKQACAQRTGAELADLESAAFARAAAAGGWAWTIVRGVSDGIDRPLPADIDRWVDRHGRTRPGIVLRSLVARRATVGQLRALRADSVVAMRAAARLIERILDAHG